MARGAQHLQFVCTNIHLDHVTLLPCTTNHTYSYIPSRATTRLLHACSAVLIPVSEADLCVAVLSGERLGQQDAEPGTLPGYSPAAARTDLWGCAQPALAAHPQHRSAHHAGPAAIHLHCFQRS